MKQKQCKQEVSDYHFKDRKHRCKGKVFADGLCFIHWTKRNRDKNKNKWSPKRN